jgi:hypothetical protein
MFSSTVRKTAEAVAETTPIDPPELVTLAELAARVSALGTARTPRPA